MTSLNFAASQSIARTQETGDEIVVIRLNHDANVILWVMAAEDLDCEVRWVGFHPSHENP